MMKKKADKSVKYFDKCVMMKFYLWSRDDEKISYCPSIGIEPVHNSL